MTPFAKFKVSANTRARARLPRSTNAAGTNRGLSPAGRIDDTALRSDVNSGDVMRSLRSFKWGIVLSTCLVLTAGCAVEATGPGGAAAESTDPGVAYADPTPMMDEVVPITPGPGYASLDGNWVWGGNHWDWER